MHDLLQAASVVDRREQIVGGALHSWSTQGFGSPRALRQHVGEPAKLDSQFDESQVAIAQQEQIKNTAYRNYQAEMPDRGWLILRSR